MTLRDPTPPGFHSFDRESLGEVADINSNTLYAGLPSSADTERVIAAIIPQTADVRSFISRNKCKSGYFLQALLILKRLWDVLISEDRL